MKKEEGKAVGIPANKVGKSVDLKESVTESSVENASTIFQAACKRLLNPLIWHELGGVLSASFELLDNNGNKPDRPAQANDHIRIDIPGPGSSAGNGYDWVIIESILQNTDASADESLSMTLKASSNPQKPKEGTAHFFEEGATSTFLITRNGKTISASYHGRNEIPNNKDVALPDKIRNSVVAASAMAGLSELQWKALLKGFLEKK